MATTTTKLYLRFVTDTGKDRIWSFSYLDTTLSESNARSLANLFIQNKIAFKAGYQPTTISAIWRETVTKQEYDINS